MAKASRYFTFVMPAACFFFFFFNCNETSGNELVDQHRHIFEFFLLYLWILGMLSNIILVADCWSLSQLDTSWVDHQSITGQTQRDRQPLRLTPTANLESPINLACSVWTVGESWSTRLLSCRHQEGFWLTGGFRPRNFWQWGNGANYNTTVDSNWMFLFLIIL